MTLEQAVAVLNREKHEGSSEWQRAYREDVPDEKQRLRDCEFHDPCGHTLSAFEAIAIAKEYERLRLERERAACGYTEWSERRQYSFSLDPTYPG